MVDMRNIIQRLDRHPMWHTLFALRGNARACVYTEPLWGVPFALLAPYATVYMYKLGVSDQQIGIILTVGMLAQVITTISSGVITDRMGRRVATMVFDTMAWCIPLTIWMLAQNFWWFVAAAAINSMWQIPNTSWSCLLVEETDQKHLVHIYSWLTICGLISVFFAPISGIMVSQWGVVSVMRVLYGMMLVMMSAKIFILYRLSTETELGRVRMAETKGVPLRSLMAGYGKVLKMILSVSQMRIVLVLLVILNITQMISGNFFALYVTQNLNIPESFLSYYPIVRAGIMLLLMFTVQHRLDQLPLRLPMGVGAFLYVAAQCVLLLAPPGNAILLFVVILVEALGFVLLIPRRDSIIAMFVDPQERARSMALLVFISVAFSSPFGWFVGWLSEHNRMLPFALNIILYTVVALLVVFAKSLRASSTKEA